MIEHLMILPDIPQNDLKSIMSSAAYNLWLKKESNKLNSQNNCNGLILSEHFRLKWDANLISKYDRDLMRESILKEWQERDLKARNTSGLREIEIQEIKIKKARELELPLTEQEQKRNRISNDEAIRTIAKNAIATDKFALNKNYDKQKPSNIEKKRVPKKESNKSSPLNNIITHYKSLHSIDNIVKSAIRIQLFDMPADEQIVVKLQPYSPFKGSLCFIRCKNYVQKEELNFDTGLGQRNVTQAIEMYFNKIILENKIEFSKAYLMFMICETKLRVLLYDELNFIKELYPEF